MTSKGKKYKKRNDSKVKQRDEGESVVAEKANVSKNGNKACFNTYFTNEEITELKSIIKTKDLSGIPFIIGAAILDKLELAKKIIKAGYNINETGQNNTTALIWAVKYKYLEVIDFLLSKGADPTVKTDNGENILIIALEHKLWDEQSFIKLWKSVNAISFIDVNYCGKNGHNMLHMAIRRDWETFVTLLLNEKPNINAANVNGITPLMLACFRNNLSTVNKLLDNEASSMREDTHRRTALCYAITTITKSAKPPFTVAERILTELKIANFFPDYIKTRLEIITQMSKKSEIPYATSEMLLNIIHFIVQYSGTGLGIILKLQVFAKIEEVLPESTGDPSKTKFYLSVMIEILFYNEQCVGFTIELYNNMVKSFCCSKILDILTEIIRNKEESNAKLCFHCIILTVTSNEEGKRWLKENYLAIASYFEHYMSNSVNFFADFEENRIKIMKRRLKKVKRFLNSTENVVIPSVSNANQESTNPNDEGKFLEAANANSKKTKRRSKAMKARIAKIKIAELSERMNLSSKKSSDLKLESPKEEVPHPEPIEPVAPELNTETETEEAPVTTDTQSEEISSGNSFATKFEIENPIVSSLKYLLERKNSPVRTEKFRNPNYPDWKNDILNLRFDDFSSVGSNLIVNQEKVGEAFDYLRSLTGSNRKCSRNINEAVAIIIEYFNELLQLILKMYRQHWANDERFQCCVYEIETDDFDEKQNYEKRLEKQCIEEVQKNYEQMISSFRTLASKNPSECYKCACNLESTLLKHEIRDQCLMPHIARYEQVRIKHNVLAVEPNPSKDFLLRYMEGVLNEQIDLRNDIDIKVVDKISENVFMDYELSIECPNELYYREMCHLRRAKPLDKRKEFEASQKTMENAYYLEDSILKICECDDDKEVTDSEETSDKNKACSKQSTCSHEYSDILLRALTKHVDNYSTEQNIPTRWSKFIASLKSMSNSQKLLNGDVRISCKEQRINHIISTGGNFNPVELGLDTNNRPLAVKRIPKESSVCKIMNSLIKPLLSLRNPHILHYYVCDYEKNELILATPLCEWNVGQYVLLMKQTSKSNLVNLGTMDIVRQFLSGLMFLHNHKDPITHGNLKPSNIFIDLKGVVRVAEFGTHQALFKIIEAPDTSLIWFSRETYQVYKQNSIMECNTASDIQVAGMLIHFILTGGKHPCGDGVYEILKNLEKAIPKLNTQDPILVDLVTWMMLYDPNERPTVSQVLSHVFFWSSSRKWKYILTCAGITPHGTPLPIDVNELHATIDKMSKRDNIKGNWVDIIRNKYPNLLISNEDTITGLLRFIRNYYEKQMQIELRDSDLSNCILAWFPALPLSLQRMLENTNWVQHAVFIPFNLLDPLH